MPSTEQQQQQQCEQPASRALVACLDLFAGLPTEIQDEIAPRLHIMNCARGETIIEFQDETRDVYFIVSGRVRITFFSMSGKQVNFHDLPAGKMFGELSALDDQPRSTHVVAAETVTLAWAPQAVFLGLLAEYPPLALSVMQDLSRNVRRLTARVVEFSTRSVKARVWAELLRLAQGADPDATEEGLIEAVTHADIASRISTHREAVTREINDLIGEGVVEKRKRSLVIRRPDILREMLDNH